MADEGGWGDYVTFDNALKAMGTLGMGAGIGGSIYGITAANRQQHQADQIAKMQRGFAGQLGGLVNQPLDVNQFYQPMSDAEQAARMRTIRADLAMRGVPQDSSYATNLTAEQMAGTESGRRDTAVGQAMNSRNLMIQALARAMGIPFPPGMNIPGVDPSGVFRYLASRPQGQPKPTPTPAAGTAQPGAALTDWGNLSEPGIQTETGGFGEAVPAPHQYLPAFRNSLNLGG